MAISAPSLIQRTSAWLSIAAISASALLPASTAFAAYAQPVTWEDMSAMDLRPAFKTQYASPDNLMDPLVSASDMDLVMRDADARISQEFHIPDTLKSTVAFWLQIYTQYTTQHVVIFDSHHPEMIYDVLDFRDLSHTARNRVVYEIVSKARVKKAMAAYRNALSRLARHPNPKKPTREEQNILAAIKKISHKHSFSELARQVRSQTGQRDNIIKGLLAAETFFPKMEQIFTKMDVPLELTRLTLVESSFNLNARSKVGASGVWQFMPKSGKEYLMIDDKTSVDERLSPLKATVAAAKLLKRNRHILGHWALAVTSFNHGVRGLPRLDAKNLKDGKEAEFARFSTLFDSCSKKKGKKVLGYASRNYYAEYLAVLHAEAYRHKFYGEPPKALVQPVAFERAKPGKTAVQIASDHGLPLQQFELYNPDVMNLHTKLPHGFLIAIPGEADDLGALTEPKHRARVAYNF